MFNNNQPNLFRRRDDDGEIRHWVHVIAISVATIAANAISQIIVHKLTEEKNAQQEVKEKKNKKRKKD